jgi:hypothetical protein
VLPRARAPAAHLGDTSRSPLSAASSDAGDTTEERRGSCTLVSGEEESATIHSSASTRPSSGSGLSDT